MGLTALTVAEGPVELSGYRPTYIPNPNYKPTYIPNSNYNSIAPIQVGGFNGVQSFQLNSSQNHQTDVVNSGSIHANYVKEVFRVVDDSNLPIRNAQIMGYEGSGIGFQEFTDSNGYVTINGTAGIWQFTVSAQEYFAETLKRKLEYDAYEILTLQKISMQRELNISQIRKKFTIPIRKTACELNEKNDQDSETAVDQPSQTGGMG